MKNFLFAIFAIILLLPGCTVTQKTGGNYDEAFCIDDHQTDLIYFVPSRSNSNADMLSFTLRVDAELMREIGYRDCEKGSLSNYVCGNRDQWIYCVKNADDISMAYTLNCADTFERCFEMLSISDLGYTMRR